VKHWDGADTEVKGRRVLKQLLLSLKEVEYWIGTLMKANYNLICCFFFCCCCAGTHISNDTWRIMEDYLKSLLNLQGLLLHLI